MDMLVVAGMLNRIFQTSEFFQRPPRRDSSMSGFNAIVFPIASHGNATDIVCFSLV